MTRHERFLVLAADSLDFALSPAKESELRAHLAGCDACARRAALLGDDQRRLARLAMLPLPVPQRVNDRVVRAVTPRDGFSLRPGLALATVLLLLAALAGGLAAAALLRNLQDARVDGPDRLPTSVHSYDGPWLPSDIALDSGWIPQYVVASGSEFLAVGLHLPAGPVETVVDGALWLSPDGRAWRELPGALPAHTAPAVAAAGKGGWLVLGNAYPAGPGSATDGLVVRSADSATWRPADDMSALANYWLSGLAVGEFGYLATGHASTCLEPPDCPPGPALFGSPDGERWTRVYGPDRSLASSSEIRSVAAAGERALAVGFAAPAGGGQVTALIWRIDLASDPWTVAPMEDPVGLEGVALNSVVAVADGWLAAASRDDQGRRLFHSPDGLTWSARETGVPSFNGLVATGGMLVAWSLAEAEGETAAADIGLWLSADDGRSWTYRAPWSGLFAPTSVAIDESGVMVVTSAPRPRDPVPAIWLTSPAQR